MEGRAAAKSSWHHGARRLCRKIGRSSGQARACFRGQFHERETTDGGRDGPVDKENLPWVGVGTVREESTEVQEEQKRRREELGSASEQDERKRKGERRLPEGIIVNDDDEDGVHGGRMKPLASFDVNRDMPPPQTRKLRIKLSSPDADQSLTMDGAPPKAVRRAQDKENRGLVPLCPGTTQIRGVKRKTVSPTESKAPGGGKRNRPPLGSGGNATEQLKKVPAGNSAPRSASEFERADSRGMDILLMALKAADEKAPEADDRNVPQTKPTVVQVTKEKALKYQLPATKGVGAIAAHLHPNQDKVDARSQDDGDSRSSDEDSDEDEANYVFDRNVMRPHRIKIRDGPSVPAPWTLTPWALEMFKEEESSGSDEGPDCTKVLTDPVKRPDQIKIGNVPSVPAPWPLEKSRKEESSGSDEGPDCAEVLAYPVRRPHRIKIGNGPSVPAAWTLEKSQREESSGSDEDSAQDSSRKHSMKPKISCRTSQKALDNSKKRQEASKEDEEDSVTTDGQELDRRMEPFWRDLRKQYGLNHELQRDRCRLQPANSLDGDKRDCKAKNNKMLDRRATGSLLDACAVKRHQFQSAAPTGVEDEEELQQDFEARNLEDAALSCSDDDVVEYVRTMRPHGYRPAPPKEAFSKSVNLLDGSKENRGGQKYHGGDKSESVIRPQLCKVPPSQVRDQVRTQARKDGIGATSCRAEEEDDEPIVVKLQHNKPLPPLLTKVVLPEKQNFRKRARKECRSTGPSCSGDAESHHQRKGIERRETSGNNCPVGISQLGEDRNRERNDLQQAPKHFTGAKYPAGSRLLQSVWRKSSGGPRSASNQQPRNYTKKRKSSDHISACFIVPKQVKLATASCLIESGAPAQPSVGSVVVECLPSPTDLQKEDSNRAPFCEIQNRDAVRSDNPLQLPPPKLAKNVDGFCDTSKENRSSSSKGTTAADCASSAGVKVPTCRQVYDGGAGPTQVVKVADKSNTLRGSFSLNSLQPLQNSRIDSGSDLQSKNVTHQPLPQEQQHQCSNATLGAGSIVRTGANNEESETRHEIAGITVQRRSWEALKSAEFFAKRRFDSKPAAENNNPNGPSIPSRFQEIHHVDEGNSNSEPLRAKFGTSHPTVGGAAALSQVSGGVNSHSSQKKVTYRRGPYKQGGDKLRTKVLNRNLENFAQLKDVRCPDGGVDFSRLHPVQNGAHQLPANGCYGPRSYSYSVFCKVPTTLKTRQRRGLKKLEKEKLKAINVKKSSSNVYKFKPLSEPSGFLGGLNPGIIQKVRNSVQIHAVLGALIRAASCNSSLPKAEPQDTPGPPPAMTEELEGVLKEKPDDVVEPLTKEEDLTRAPTTSDAVQETLHDEENLTQAEASVKVEEAPQTQECFMAVGGSKEEEQGPEVQGSGLGKETLDCDADLLSNREQSEPLSMPSQLHQYLLEKEGLPSLKDEDVIADRLQEQSKSLVSPMVSDDSQHAEEDSDEQELQPMSGTDSSPTAAGLAGRWLELLTLDIKGRLSALKQSRRRVQSTLNSGQLNPESASAAINPPSTTRSAIDGLDVLGSQQSVSSDATAGPQTNTQAESSSRQVDRWRALFANMDGVLGTEATKLESWLWQIKQMQSFCPGSIPQPFSAPVEKSDVAPPCQGGLPPSNVEFEKQQPAERWPLSFEAMQKELRIRRIGCFDNVQS